VPRWTRSADYILLAAIIAVIAYQSTYLFAYPQIDTGAWFGDESWTMLTLREMARSGVARIPEAIGSSIAQSNGFVNGVVWVSALIYGLPANVAETLSPVEVGRIVTLLVSLALVASMYGLLSALRIGRTVSLAVLLVFVASPVFFFSSHSARLDTITALAIVAALAVFLRMLRAVHPRYALVGGLVALSLAIYVHVPTLIALPWLAAVVFSAGGYSRWTRSIAGAACGTLLLGVTYYLSVGNLDVLGSGQNQYYSVARALPVLHPFSWQVQKINTIDRFIQVWGVAWPIVVMLVAAVVLLVRGRKAIARDERAMLLMCALVVLSWMLFEGPAVFYEIHAAPVFAVAAAIGLQRARRIPVVLTVAALVLAAGSMYAQRDVGEAGRELTEHNRTAVRSLLRTASTATPGATVLADQPAWDLTASTPGVHLMTSHLLLFGGEPRPVPEILRVHNVQYLLLYSTRQFQSPFRHIADSLYQLQDMQTGTLTDEARTYDRSTWRSPDTVRLYRARWLP
jgi:hypothetical protein